MRDGEDAENALVHSHELDREADRAGQQKVGAQNERVRAALSAPAK